jgi:uncharacterized protein
MEYKTFRQGFCREIVVRMDRGEEILSSLRSLIEKEGITLGKFTAIGAIDSFTVGVYDVSERKYESKTYKGAYEIVSLTGNINTMDNKPYIHLHMSAADKENHVVGGHLNEAHVSATIEMFISVIDGKVDRFKDEVTGLNLFKF